MKKILLLIFLASLAFFSELFGANNEATLLKKTIETGRARELKTDISFFAGKLRVNGLTDELSECFYGYKTKYIRPDMKYHEIGRTGYLSIESEKQSGRRFEDIANENEWNLSLNSRIKNAVSIQLKAGEADIDLENCNISRFDYRMAAGESNVNLRNTSVPDVNFSMTAGEANIDLSGKWRNDLNANIKGGVGELNIKVPYNVGVRITVSGLIGEVKIPFFNRNGRTFTNDAFNKTNHTLYIDINGGIGEINVEMTE